MKKLYLFLVFISIFSCEKIDDQVGTLPVNPSKGLDLGRDLTTKISGIVTDLRGKPLQMVEVKVGGQVVLTDINGVFRVEKATVKEKLAFVKASKAGFMSASRSLVPTSGTNIVYISMIPNTPIATFASGSQQTVNLKNGTSLVFPGGFKDENGNSYTGNVSVSAYHLEKSNPNISSLMPGMLFAQTTNNEARALETYGMMNVELQGSSGQKLQPTGAVTMKMKIDASQTSSAPSTIKLWHFDDVKGYWVEEGSATRVGNEYVGNVTHFSWWNCDAPFPQIILTVKLETSNGIPISGINVGIKRVGQNYPAMGVTDTNGMVSGIVPANEPLTLEVYPQGCNTSIYTQAIGPFSANTTLPTIVLNPSSNVAVITGNLVNCSNAAVTNGYVILKNNGALSLQNVTNGAFSFPTIFCTPSVTFSVEGYDATANQIAPLVNYTMSSNSTINLGNIVACTAVTEYISYTVTGQATQTIISNINADITSTNIRISGGVNTPFINISLDATATGTYNASLTSKNFFEGTLGFSNTLSSGMLPTNPVVFTLTTYPAVGGYIDINFSGDYYTYAGSNTPTLKSVQGTVHVIRDN